MRGKSPERELAGDRDLLELTEAHKNDAQRLSDRSPHGLEARNESTESSSNPRSFSDNRRVCNGSLAGSRDRAFHPFNFSTEYAMNGLCTAQDQGSALWPLSCA